MATPTYSLSFYDDFDAPVEAMFELFVDLKRIHLWTAGMQPVTDAARMTAGLTYTAINVTAGQPTRSRVTVTELVPLQRVRLVNSGSIVTYDALVLFSSPQPQRTRITCNMHFNVSAGVLEEAKPVIEAMAEARVRGNWEVLRTLLPKPASE
jgi:hypothetical protein